MPYADMKTFLRATHVQQKIYISRERKSLHNRNYKCNKNYTFCNKSYIEERKLDT